MTTALQILCPLAVEARAIRAGLPGQAVRRTGAGRRRSQLAAPVTAAPLAIAGVAGALDPGLQAGDVVVATELVEVEDGRVRSRRRLRSAELLVAALRARGQTVVAGPLATVNRVVLTAARRRALAAATGAVAVDTESAYLTAGARGPVAVVRAVSDLAGQPLLSPSTVSGGFAALRSLRAAAPVLRDWHAAVAAREVLLAGPRSFCAGVERAVTIVERTLARHGAPVYVRRQIVHNAHVVADLERRGAVFVHDLDEVPAGAVVVFSAHGVAAAVREEAARRSLNVVDATCPLVAKVHAEARRFAGRGDTVVLIGHDGHDEVEGTLGSVPGATLRLVQDAQQAQELAVPDPARVSFLMQTTLAVDEAYDVVDALRARFPAVRGPASEDICYATTNRQAAVRAVARDSDLVLVLGSANSSNSQRLVEIASREGTPAYLVDDAEGIDLRWLAGASRVGITAGASAPAYLVDDVVDALAGLGPVTRRERPILEESLTFALPKEVS